MIGGNCAVSAGWSMPHGYILVCSPDGDDGRRYQIYDPTVTVLPCSTRVAFSPWSSPVL